MDSVFATVISGTCVFIFGQLVLKLLIEPVHQLKRTLADISHTFVVHADLLCNIDVISTEQKDELRSRLRTLCGQIHSDMALIPCYSIVRWIFFLPQKDNLYAGAQNLIGIGNHLYAKNASWFEHITKLIDTAHTNLRLYQRPQDRLSD
ncbi:hypothetical protein Q9Q94_10440 [Uliginosibacterium sp. 31-16]|uniref:hypothetical protein n=1 Tax=Uliginosibacterium sp. 31-16 TaxID=3068315 RepID=UPI00273F0CA7|nr:hypothetical protein [Uliginosibacterium sp. 31-16]MDP5239954.1 hypothetical protein [Uliginosibacterium sp. 31-16]